MVPMACRSLGGREADLAEQQPPGSGSLLLRRPFQPSIVTVGNFTGLRLLKKAHAGRVDRESRSAQSVHAEQTSQPLTTLEWWFCPPAGVG